MRVQGLYLMPIVCSLIEFHTVWYQNNVKYFFWVWKWFTALQQGICGTFSLSRKQSCYSFHLNEGVLRVFLYLCAIYEIIWLGTFIRRIFLKSWNLLLKDMLILYAHNLSNIPSIHWFQLKSRLSRFWNLSATINYFSSLKSSNIGFWLISYHFVYLWLREIICLPLRIYNSNNIPLIHLNLRLYYG